MNSIINYLPELLDISGYLAKLFDADTYEMQQEWENKNG